MVKEAPFLKKLLCSRKRNNLARVDNESLEKIGSVSKYMTCERPEVREADTKKKQRQKEKTEGEWKIMGLGVCVTPLGMRTALCAVGISIICEQNVWIPLSSLGTDCHCSESSASVFGVTTNTLFGLWIQRAFVWVTLFHHCSAIPLFSLLRVLETSSLSVRALSYSLSLSLHPTTQVVSSSHWSSLQED